MSKTLKIFGLSAAAIVLSGCGVAKTTAKVASLPFKAGYEVAETTGKVAYGTAKFTSKGIVAVGKGVYYVGSVPVTITDAALDTTTKVVTITTQLVDLTGKTVTVARNVQAAQLEQELLKYKGAKNVISVFVDAFL